MEKPDSVNRLGLVLSTGEYLVYTDEYIAVLLDNSVVGAPRVHGEVQEDSVLSENVVNVSWDDIDAVAQETISSYVLNQTTEKGARNEREAVNLLGRVRGSGNVEKVDSFATQDPFSLVDVIGVGEDWERVLFVQVKTNSFTAEEKRKYKRDMRRLNFDSVRFEVWVRVDYDGWTMYSYNPEKKEFEVTLEMETTDYGETVEALREREDFYQ